VPLAQGGELRQACQHVGELIHGAGRRPAGVQHAAGTAQGDVDGAAAALGGADAQSRGFADHGGVSGVAAQAAGQRAVGAAELLVHHGLEDEIACQAHARLAQCLENREVHGYAGLHVPRAPAVKAAVFGLGGEWLARPRDRRVDGDRVDVAGKDQGPPASAALEHAADVGTARVVPAGPELRVPGEARDIGELIDVGGDAQLPETRGHIGLAGQLMALRRKVLRRNPDQVGEGVEQIGLESLHRLGGLFDYWHRGHRSS